MTTRQHAIDLTRHAFKRVKGELALYGSWIYNEAQEDYEPALIVVNAHAPRRFKPCVVALSAAYKYNDAQYMAHVAAEFVKLLGLADNVSMAYAVALLLEDSLGDLLTMPPNPMESVVVADGTVGSGLAKRGFEIVDYVPSNLS